MREVELVPDKDRSHTAIVHRIDTVIQTVVRKVRLTPVGVPAGAKVIIVYARSTDGAILTRAATPLGSSAEDVAFELSLPNVDTEFGVAYAGIDLRESAVEWLASIGPEV